MGLLPRYQVQDFFNDKTRVGQLLAEQPGREPELDRFMYRNADRSRVYSRRNAWAIVGPLGYLAGVALRDKVVKKLTGRTNPAPAVDYLVTAGTSTAFAAASVAATQLAETVYYWARKEQGPDDHANDTFKLKNASLAIPQHNGAAVPPKKL